jgi:hypothetical protein
MNKSKVSRQARICDASSLTDRFLYPGRSSSLSRAGGFFGNMGSLPGVTPKWHLCVQHQSFPMLDLLKENSFVPRLISHHYQTLALCSVRRRVHGDGVTCCSSCSRPGVLSQVSWERGGARHSHNCAHVAMLALHSSMIYQYEFISRHEPWCA